ncbi:uncharacterized protein [Primulina eburnea]|uniref:uncharacterized protein n=1 Tax=Primulina eburnea TaxID=1245227 RepID=UPI003C6C27A0
MYTTYTRPKPPSPLQALIFPPSTPARYFEANPFLPAIFLVRFIIFPMRIRGVKQSPAADCSAISRSTSSRSSSSSSSSSSSVTATHSLASSQDSSNSSPFSLITASSRCPGLDLLVKAIHQITAGSVVGVPYIQRRVTIRRRRRRMSSLDGFIHTGIVGEKGVQDEKKTWIDTRKTNKKKIGRRTVYQMVVIIILYENEGLQLLEATAKKRLSKQLSMCEIPRDMAWERRRRQFLCQDRRQNGINDNVITDEDMNGLKGCIELEFGFNEEDSQRLCHWTLDLYFAVNRQFSTSPISSPGSSGGSTSSSTTSIGGRSSLFGSMTSDSDSWKICSPCMFQFI